MFLDNIFQSRKAGAALRANPAAAREIDIRNTGRATLFFKVFANLFVVKRIAKANVHLRIIIISG